MNNSFRDLCFGMCVAGYSIGVFGLGLVAGLAGTEQTRPDYPTPARWVVTLPNGENHHVTDYKREARGARYTDARGRAVVLVSDHSATRLPEPGKGCDCD